MSDFFYKAISTTGEVKQGTINADDQQGVVAWLQSQRLSPLVIKPNHSWSIVPLLHYRQRVKMADIVAFTQQLATMLNAGLPMERALQLLLKMNRQPAMQHHLDSIIAKVRDGESLSNALESCKNLVPTLYISMIRAGETRYHSAKSERLPQSRPRFTTQYCLCTDLPCHSPHHGSRFGDSTIGFRYSQF
jgi:general secretion pathway protein F